MWIEIQTGSLLNADKIDAIYRERDEIYADVRGSNWLLGRYETEAEAKEMLETLAWTIQKDSYVFTMYDSGFSAVETRGRIELTPEERQELLK